MSIEVKRHRYVLDWYEIDTVVIDDEKFNSFEMQYRCGSWYLLHHVHEDGEFKHAYEHDFCLSSPRDALKALGSKLTKFSSLHGGGDKFNQELARLVGA